jgi:signal transduction histidine kinase
MLDILGGAAWAAVVTALTAWLEHVGPIEAGTRAVDVVGYVLVAVAGAALAWRIVADISTFSVVLVLGIAYQTVGYPGGPAPIPIIIAVYTLAAHGRRQLSLGLGLLAAVVLIGARGLAVDDGLRTPLLIAFPTCLIAALYVGQLVSARHQARLDQVRLAQESERRHEQEARHRVDAERLRIARELHDVVAHNISLINVQATMGVHLIAQRPDKAAAALAEIKVASRQALGELRRVLNVLRQVDEGIEPVLPTPGLADLQAMIAGTRTAGLPIRVVITGDPVYLPTMVDIAAYRIVQESLTNALRYAAPAPTSVTLTYAPTCLTIDVHDNGRPPGNITASGSGHGILGMQERAAAAGGTLTAEPTSTGGFRVLAQLPLPGADW